MEQLKPCPFCGSKEFNYMLSGHNGNSTHRTHCIKCDAAGPSIPYEGYSDKDGIGAKIKDAWNQRAESAELAILRRMVDVGTREYCKVAVALTGDWVAEKDEPEVYRRFAQEWREQAESEGREIGLIGKTNN